LKFSALTELRLPSWLKIAFMPKDLELVLLNGMAAALTELSWPKAYILLAYRYRRFKETKWLQQN